MKHKRKIVGTLMFFLLFFLLMVFMYIVSLLDNDGASGGPPQRPVPEVVYDDLSRPEGTPQIEFSELLATELGEYPYTIIGYSVERREIRAYRFGNGDKKLFFICGLHGGYEWNSALLAYTVMEYALSNPGMIPGDIEVVVIPVVNPDGLHKVVGTFEYFNALDAPQFAYAYQVSPDSLVVQGRFNAHGVDLNRNFNCEWKPTAVWREHPVNPGPAAFSEPESRALRDFISEEQPKAVVFYHSSADGLYRAQCGNLTAPGMDSLLLAYSQATGYPAYDDYSYYAISGDATDWLATQGIPGLTVELSRHDVLEWEQNKRGMEAMFELYSDFR